MSERNPVATNHRELIVWQLCASIRRIILYQTRVGPAKNDYRYRSQIRAAARASCYLTSEGFYRKRDGDFANFLVWARGSIGETLDQIEDGYEEGYFTEEQFKELFSLIKRAFKGNRRLTEYLRASISEPKQKPLSSPQPPATVKWTWRKRTVATTQEP